MSNLADRAVIARLRRREFPYYVSLKGKGKQVEDAAGAESNTVRDPQQRLFKHWDDFNKLKNSYAQCYNWLRSVTRPWDDGSYLLPNENVLEQLEKFGEFKRTASKILDDMESSYDLQVAKDKVIRGNVAKDDDYPSSFAAFRDRFSMDLDLDPIGNPNDFRNVGGLDPEQVDKLVQDAEQRLANKAKEGAKGIVEKLVKPLLHLGTVLEDEDKSFKKNSLENVREACKLVRSLNFDNDPAIETWIQEVQSQFKDLTADVIRDNVDVRKDVASNAKKLADQMKSFLA